MHEDLTRVRGDLFADRNRVLHSIIDAVSGELEIDRAGIAVRDASGKFFEVFAHATRIKIGRGEPGSRFPYDGTVGKWVCERNKPFYGYRRSEILPFPATFDFFVEERIESNWVGPLAVNSQVEGAVYLLSRTPAQFSPKHGELLDSIRRFVESYLALTFAITDGPKRHRTQPPTNGNGVNGHVEQHSPLSLAQVQKIYIESVLGQTRGVIEGPQGAARILGLPPSTLRNRMKRLGASRPEASTEQLG